ncbi:hypothetical protein ES707_11619 [subsurface metagenome]
MTNGFLDDLPDLNLPGGRKKKKSSGPGGPKSEDEVVRYVRLRCPKCGNTNVPVQHTNPEVDGNIVRHHKCSDCGKRFKSVEE